MEHERPDEDTGYRMTLEKTYTKLFSSFCNSNKNAYTNMCEFVIDIGMSSSESTERT